MAIVDPNKLNVGQALGNSDAKVFKEFDLIPVMEGSVEGIAQVTLFVENFTCRCPITNQPDQATVKITYNPNKFYLETKSLKLYIESFRERGIFHEHLTHVVTEDVRKALNPQYIRVTTNFSSRGGISVETTEDWIEEASNHERFTHND